jgi:50S ribosomal subunit-associated GTPase HflX
VDPNCSTEDAYGSAGRGLSSLLYKSDYKKVAARIKTMSRRVKNKKKHKKTKRRFKHESAIKAEGIGPPPPIGG